MKKLSLKIPLRGDTTAKHNHAFCAKLGVRFRILKTFPVISTRLSLIFSHLKTVKLSKSIFTPKNSWRS